MRTLTIIIGDTEATFDIPKDWSYHYIEIEDEAGRRAWTNALFT